MRRLILTMFLVLASFGVGVAVTWHHFHRTVSTAPNLPTVPTKTSPPTAPVLREKFTLLACNVNTTIGMEGCAEHHIVFLDTKINQRRVEIFSQLYNQTAKRSFVSAEDSWLTYRETTCASNSNVYAGGSLAPVEFARCEVRLNQQHLSNLSELLKSY
ncbi:MAG TPA: lysozyme inhibitor LprI family protein [Acidimicrobiales bacterium]